MGGSGRYPPPTPQADSVLKRPGEIGLSFGVNVVLYSTFKIA